MTISDLARKPAPKRRVPYAKAITAATTRQEDFVLPYLRDLENVVDMAAIRGLKAKSGTPAIPKCPILVVGRGGLEPPTR